MARGTDKCTPSFQPRIAVDAMLNAHKDWLNSWHEAEGEFHRVIFEDYLDENGEYTSVQRLGLYPMNWDSSTKVIMVCIKVDAYSGESEGGPAILTGFFHSDHAAELITKTLDDGTISITGTTGKWAWTNWELDSMTQYFDCYTNVVVTDGKLNKPDHIKVV